MSPGSTQVARRFYVKGRVQQVGFRWFVDSEARMLGLTGHTRNLGDGRVEVLAQGPPEALERLAALLREGPALSRVENVESFDTEIRPELAEFRITY